MINALRNLYDESRSQIKLGNDLYGEFVPSKVIDQGCCISITLFKIYDAKSLQTWKMKCKGMGVDLEEYVCTLCSLHMTS